MSMPYNLVLVRHGESEANLAQRLEKAGQGDEIPEGFWDRPDWEHRLSPRGEEQAVMAGKWLIENYGNLDQNFDKRYVSPFIRTRETAKYIGGLSCNWIKDDRLIERSWGKYGATPLGERQDLFAHTERMHRQSSLYTQYDNGESIGYNTVFRVRDWLGTLHRGMDEKEEKNILAVTHGEFMWATRFVLDNMLPEEWNAHDQDKSQKIRNCSIIHYSREDPETGEIARTLNWRRLIYPDNVKQSPFNGAWQELPGKRYMTSAELTASVDAVPRLFPVLTSQSF